MLQDHLFLSHHSWILPYLANCTMPRGRRLRQQLEQRRIERERIEEQNQRRCRVQLERLTARQHLEEMERLHRERLQQQDIPGTLLRSWFGYACRTTPIRWTMVIIFCLVLYILFYVWWFQITNRQFFQVESTVYFTVMLVYYLFEVYEFIYPENPFKPGKLLFMISMGIVRIIHDNAVEKEHQFLLSAKGKFFLFRINQWIANCLLTGVPGGILVQRYLHDPGFMERNSWRTKVYSIIIPIVCYYLCTAI